MSDEKRPVFDVRWESGDAECMFGAEDYEPELAARQDSVCEAADVTAVSYPGEEQPPYQAHVYLHIEEDQRPHDRQARVNHGGQMLARLSERGGLSVRELLVVVRDQEWSHAIECMDHRHAVEQLEMELERWNTKDS